MPKGWRERAENKKQGSKEEFVDVYPLDKYYQQLVDDALCLYEDLLAENVAPEQARMVLPQSALTEFIWTGSLLGWANMCRLRCAEDAQAETREIAQQIAAKMEELFPVSWPALMGT